MSDYFKSEDWSVGTQGRFNTRSYACRWSQWNYRSIACILYFVDHIRLIYSINNIRDYKYILLFCKQAQINMIIVILPLNYDSMWIISLLRIYKTINYIMARTNKQWIAKQKAQQERQRKLMEAAGTIGNDTKQNGEKLTSSQTNPKWHTYDWFLRGSKWVCDATTWREDPDWYRILRQPSGGGMDWVERKDSFHYKRYVRRGRRMIGR